MKKTKKLFSGFTITELLISMLIAMLVAAAMVPVIGPKREHAGKMKGVVAEHGLMECWADSDGVHQRYIDSAGRTREEDVSSGYCEFNVPAAKNMSMVLIGAGDAGGDDPQEIVYDVNYAEGVNAPRGDIKLNSWMHDWQNLFSHDAREVILPGNKDEDFGPWMENMFRLWRTVLEGGSFRTTDGHTVNFGERIPDNEKFNTTIYAEFYDIVGPLSTGGASLSWIEKVEGCNGNGYLLDNEHRQAFLNVPLYHFSNNLLEEIKDYNATHTNNPVCYYPQYSSGGTGRKGINTKSGVHFLFPLTETSQVLVDGGLGNDTNNSPRALEVGVQAGESKNAIGIMNYESGRNAEKNRNGKDATDQVLVGFEYFYNPTAYQRILYTTGGQRHDLLNTFANNNVIHQQADSRIQVKVNDLDGLGLFYYVNGMPGTSSLHSDLYNINNSDIIRPAGQAQETWLSYEGNENARAGSMNFTNPAFTWSLGRVPKISYKSGKAGKAGIVQTINFSGEEKMPKGKLRLYPASENAPDKSYIIDETNVQKYQVSSQASNDKYQQDVTEDTTTIHPKQEFMQKAIPENNEIKDAIKELVNTAKYGKDSIFADCINNNHCPGYGGAGIYPLLYNIPDADATLRIRNNQAYVGNANSKSYSFNNRMSNGNDEIVLLRPNSDDRTSIHGKYTVSEREITFTRTTSFNNGILPEGNNCADGFDQITNSSYKVPQNSVNIRKDLVYCKGREQRGYGAIIITW